jgi:hypothetical protein
MEHSHETHQHDHSIIGELICHMPYAIFSVAFGLVVLSFVTFSCFGDSTESICLKSDVLFHSFHFMHIVFAATGTLITFFRFSRNNTRALLVGIFSPAIFCTLSDSILPYIGGQMLGVDMTFHLCFVTELPNVLPFLIVGIINGFILSKHEEGRELYAIASHSVHILISSLASIFYLVSHGCTDWYLIIGPVFLFLIFAVVVPCTLSDVVVPMLFARVGTKHEKH